MNRAWEEVPWTTGIQRHGEGAGRGTALVETRPQQFCASSYLMFVRFFKVNSVDGNRYM
jgi:hypothetical protein